MANLKLLRCLGRLSYTDMMQESIADRIANVRIAARRVALWRGGLHVLLVVILASLVCCLIDILIRPQDSVTRWLLSIAVLATAIGAAWRWLVPVWRTDWSDQSIARFIERRFPALEERLSSAAAFLRQSGESYGSQPMMQNVIASTAHDVANLDLGDAINWRPLKVAAWRLMATLVVLVVLGSANSAIATKAIGRLLTPWRADRWPRLNQLAFVESPNRLGMGADLKLAVVDLNGKLPPRVDVQIQADGELDDIKVIPMTREKLESGEHCMVYELRNIRRSFRYRAVGGDDLQMAWTRLKVVEPPRVTTGTITLTPPTYTGWLPRTIPQAVASFRVMEGTGIEFSGEVDRPLASCALLIAEGDGELSRSLGNGIVYADARQYRTETWQIQASSDYSLRLIDQQGTATVDGDRWTVRVVNDTPPELHATDGDDEEIVTPQAVIEVEYIVKDDLRTRWVELCYSRSDQTADGDQRIVLFQGDDVVPTQPMPEQIPADEDIRRVQYQWSIESMRPAVGSVVTYYLTAEDYRPQSARTAPRRLMVVSEAELISRVGRRQALVLSRLRQRLKQQRRARDGVDEARRRLAGSNAVGQQAIDQLQAALLLQRQVNAALTGQESEVDRELEALKNLLQRSRVVDTEVHKRIDVTLESVRKLATEQLDPALMAGSAAHQSLQAARDQHQLNSGDVDDSMPRVPLGVDDQLQVAFMHQDHAVRAMESLLDDMSTWDNYRRFVEELGDLLREQQAVGEATDDVAAQTMSRNLSDLDGRQRAALQSAAARQSELARRMDHLLLNLGRSKEELQSADPHTARMIEDAMEAAEGGTVSGRMREAGRQISQNRIGLALQQQADAVETLEEMLGELTQRSFTSDERIDRLGKLSRELQQLLGRQGELSRAFQEMSNQSGEAARDREMNRLVQTQQDVIHEAQKLQRRLQRLRANESSQQIGRAAQSLEAAEDSAGQGDAQQALQHSQRAEEQMQRAAESLQREQLKSRAEVSEDQMEGLPGLIDGFIDRQREILLEVQGLELRRASDGEWTAPQLLSRNRASNAERVLSQDTATVAGEISQLPAFVFALNELESQMIEMAERLQQWNTSDVVVELGSRVINDLQRLRDMIELSQEGAAEEDVSASNAAANNENQDTIGPSNQPQDLESLLAQLMLLRELQISINAETERLRRIIDAGDDSLDQADFRLQRLSSRQGELARIVTELTAASSVEAAETNRPEQRPSDDRREEMDTRERGLDALDRELDLPSLDLP